MKSATLTLAIAGIPVRFDLPSPFALRLKKALAPFLGASARPVARIRVDTITRLGRAGKKPVIHDTPNKFLARRGDMVFQFDYTEMSGRLLIVQDRFVFNAFLRIFFSSLLPRMNGLVLHASAIASSKGALVFAGVSGSGKTTTARLLSAYDVLTDELAILRKEKGGFFVHGSPFRGEFKGKLRVKKRRISGLFVLKKGKEFGIRPTPAHEGIRRLLQCILYFDRNKTSVLRLWKVAESLFSATGVSELTFPKNRKQLIAGLKASGSLD